MLQPADKTLKTMAIEFAEYQVNLGILFLSYETCGGVSDLIYVLLSGLCRLIRHNPKLCGYCLLVCDSQDYWWTGKSVRFHREAQFVKIDGHRLFKTQKLS